eukprot:gene26405-17502_t
MLARFSKSTSRGESLKEPHTSSQVSTALSDASTLASGQSSQRSGRVHAGQALQAPSGVHLYDLAFPVDNMYTPTVLSELPDQVSTIAPVTSSNNCNDVMQASLKSSPMRRQLLELLSPRSPMVQVHGFNETDLEQLLDSFGAQVATCDNKWVMRPPQDAF